MTNFEEQQLDRKYEVPAMDPRIGAEYVANLNNVVIHPKAEPVEIGIRRTSSGEILRLVTDGSSEVVDDKKE